MRRLTLVIDNLNRIGKGSFFEKISEMEVIHYLRSDADGLAGIWRIVLKDPRASPRTLLRSKGPTWWSRLSRMKFLSKDPVGFVAYVEIGSHRSEKHAKSLDIQIVSLEFKGGALRLMVIGETKELRRLIQQIASDGMDYKVTEISDPEFEADSPLSSLTVRQRKVQIAAFEAGYHDVPRKIDSQSLAHELNLDKSTVVEHLRKAEKRLLGKLLVRGGN